MRPDEAEAKLVAALALALASTHGLGAVSTARLLETAQASFGLAERDALLAMDRLASRGRLVEHDGTWSLRVAPGPAPGP
jgi:hypothetical protein